MGAYANNPKVLMQFAPFRALALSAAYLTPFFLEKGMSTAKIFLLQSVFSLAVVVWELPSGYLADRFGRAKCIKLSLPLAAVGMVAYGFGNSFAYFAVCELFLAAANGLISGADKALLVDSLNAEGRGSEIEHYSQSIRAISFGAVAFGVPVSILLVSLFGIAATLVADGILTAIGGFFVMRLVEVPSEEAEDHSYRTALAAVIEIVSSRTARQLILLTLMLNGTYFTAWLAPVYYREIGIPLVMFSVVLAFRSLVKFILGMRFRRITIGGRGMRRLAWSGGAGHMAIALANPLTAPFLLSHDAVHMLHGGPIDVALHRQFTSVNRALQGSVVNLVARLYFAVMGPLIGLMVDKYGLRSMAFFGLATSAVALSCLRRLRVAGVYE